MHAASCLLTVVDVFVYCEYCEYEWQHTILEDITIGLVLNMKIRFFVELEMQTHSRIHPRALATALLMI